MLHLHLHKYNSHLNDDTIGCEQYLQYHVTGVPGCSCISRSNISDKYHIPHSKTNKNSPNTAIIRV